MPAVPHNVSNATTWADGHGIWHVRLELNELLTAQQSAERSAELSRYARSLIVQEITLREQTTSEDYATAERRIRSSLGMIRAQPTTSPHTQLVFSER